MITLHEGYIGNIPKSSLNVIRTKVRNYHLIFVLLFKMEIGNYLLIMPAARPAVPKTFNRKGPAVLYTPRRLGFI